MEIIIPCAGLSTRFPNLRPKYLLVDYSGKMMIETAIENFLGKYPITIVILDEHNKKFNAEKKLRDALGSIVKIVILERPTDGPADTVYQAIKSGQINLSKSILIKDCDAFCDTTIMNGNIVYVSKLSKHTDIRNAPAKSYVIANEQGIISTIVEKQIVSDSFCIGSYQFETAQSYIDTFEKLHPTKSSEIFVSNIIDYMISNGDIFFTKEVDNFIDVGTADDWFRYNDRPTYFCDIDGTIIKSKDHSEPAEILSNNVEKLKKELARGCKIIFCTARPKKYGKITRQILDENGFEECELIMEVSHSKRILINDYAASNPYPSAVAVNLQRDSDNLGDMI